MVIRHLDQTLIDHLKNRREALILLGARQVGKTTILKRLFPTAYYLTVDNESVRLNLERYDASVYQQYIPLRQGVLVIDEIHLLSDPGRAAKIFFDQIPGIKLILTGSSSFHIKNKTSESLAGRKIEYRLFPLSLTEYLVQKNIRGRLDFPVLTQLANENSLPPEKIYPFDLNGILDNVLSFGLYPALLNQPNDTLYLNNLVDSIIFRDLLTLSLIENRPAALNLLKLLAFQIGSLVNFSELSNRLGTDVKTVKRYISLFEQSFIIFTLPPFSQRGRDEIGKMPKIYFYDVGLRNALIDNFQPVTLRPDAGVLWENFIAAEIFKANYYGNFDYQLHFWRTKQGSEMDLVLTRGSEITGLEIKNNWRRVNMAFKNRYPQAQVTVVTKKNLY